MKVRLALFFFSTGTVFIGNLSVSGMLQPLSES